jgi:hypothetical protein
VPQENGQIRMGHLVPATARSAKLITSVLTKVEKKHVKNVHQIQPQKRKVKQFVSNVMLDST